MRTGPFASMFSAFSQFLETCLLPILMNKGMKQENDKLRKEGRTGIAAGYQMMYPIAKVNPTFFLKQLSGVIHLGSSARPYLAFCCMCFM
jgi:hypothetical protein